jgi:hypothetical protein
MLLGMGKDISGGHGFTTEAWRNHVEKQGRDAE